MEAEGLTYDKLIAISKRLNELHPKKPKFFILLHTDDFYTYKDNFDVDIYVNYTYLGVNIVFSQYADKGVAQVLPIYLIESR